MRVENDIFVAELARLLQEEKEVRFTPSGDSMRPFIEGGADHVVLAPLTAEPRIGDILLARALKPDGRHAYVLHRLVRMEPDEAGNNAFVLQGDGNLSGEEVCRRKDIIGVVKAIEKAKGRSKCLTLRRLRLSGRLWLLFRPWRKHLLKHL